MGLTRATSVVLGLASLAALASCDGALTPPVPTGSGDPSPCVGVYNAAGHCVEASANPSPSPSVCMGTVDAAGVCVPFCTTPAPSPSICAGVVNAAGQCIEASASPAATSSPAASPTPSPEPTNGAGATPTPSPTATPSASAWPLSETVNIYNPMQPFGPQTVTIAVGGTVTFNNVDSGVPWTIKSVGSPSFPWVPLATSPSTGTTTAFTVPGTYEYMIDGTNPFTLHGFIIVN